MKETLHDSVTPSRCMQISIWPCWVVLFVGLSITAIATQYANSNVESFANLEFSFSCNEIQRKIVDRFRELAQILRSCAALFEVDEQVRRSEWRAYAKTQNLEGRLPGIQGIGFSPLISHDQLSRQVQSIRDEDFSKFRIKPEGDREIYSPVVYLEPFSEANLHTIGYDMLTESVRRTAMEYARDTDEAALSGKVVMSQGTAGEFQVLTLMFVPVYRKGMPTETVSRRRDAIQGWVFCSYVMQDLMRGIIVASNVLNKKPFKFQIFDDEATPGGTFNPNLVYDSQTGGKENLWIEASFTRQFSVDLYGQRWTLNFTQARSRLFATEYHKVWLVLGGGIIVSLLLFAVIRSQFDIRFKEGQMEELRQSEDLFRSVIESTDEGILLLSIDLDIVALNASFAKLHGYTVEEMLKKNIRDFDTPESAQQAPERRRRVLAGEALTFEVQQHTRSGQILLLEVLANVITVRGEKRILAFHRDISTRKRAEENIIRTLEEKEGLLKELNEALAKVKLLSGFLPICASCKKIRDDKGYWQQIEAYIRDHSEAEFTHSLCPDCGKKLYGEFFPDSKES